MKSITRLAVALVALNLSGCYLCFLPCYLCAPPQVSNVDLSSALPEVEPIFAEAPAEPSTLPSR